MDAYVLRSVGSDTARYMLTASYVRSMRGILVAVCLVAVVGVAGCIGPFADDPGAAETVERLNVPDSADSVVVFDADVLDDPTTEELVDTTVDSVLSQESGYDGPDSYDEAVEEISEEFEEDLGIDPFEVDEAVFFAEIPEADEDDPEEYAALVVSSDWEEDDLQSFLTSAEDEDVEVEEDSYKDVPFYTMVEDVDNFYVADLGDGTYAMSYEEGPVRDVVDVSVGDAEALSGELREELASIRAGHISYAAEFPSSYIEDDPAAQEFDLEPFEEIAVVGGSYFTEGDEVGLSANIRATSSEDAEEVEEAVDGLLSASSLFLPEEYDVFIDPVEVERDGESVEALYRDDVDSITESIRGLEELAQDDATATPQAGLTTDYDASAEGVEITVIDPGNVDSVQVVAGGGSVDLPAEAGAQETVDVSDTDAPVSVIGTVGENEAVLMNFDGHLE